jgi:hypothetical protein
MLQAELRENSLRNNPSEWEQNNNYYEQDKAPLMDEDWELVTRKKKRNRIQISSTNVNKVDLVHNLKKDEERNNMGINERGETNVRNYTLIKGKNKYVEMQSKHKHKIRIIGDSHIKKSAAELRVILEHRYEIMGFTKPGALMTDIMKTATDECTLLSNKYILVLLAGANDISKNNTAEAPRSLTKFLEGHKRINIILIHTLHRHDLSTTSCVNMEVLKFNRQVKRIIKLNPKAKLMEVELQRKHFTRHGQHLN